MVKDSHQPISVGFYIPTLFIGFPDERWDEFITNIFGVDQPQHIYERWSFDICFFFVLVSVDLYL